jgi:hypothetical protein
MAPHPMHSKSIVVAGRRRALRLNNAFLDLRVCNDTSHVILAVVAGNIRIGYTLLTFP